MRNIHVYQGHRAELVIGEEKVARGKAAVCTVVAGCSPAGSGHSPLRAGLLTLHEQTVRKIQMSDSHMRKLSGTLHFRNGHISPPSDPSLSPP